MSLLLKGGSIAILCDNGTELKNAVLNDACEQPGIKRLYSNLFHPQGNSRIENVQNFLKRTFTKFLDSSYLVLDEVLPFACYCYNIFSSSNGTEPPFYLMFTYEPAEGWLTHLNNCSRYHGDNSGQIILAELHKMWKHHATYLKDIQYRKDDSKPYKPRNNTKFEIGQTVMLNNHAHHTPKPKYLMDYRVLETLSQSTLLLVTPNGRECKI